jgi:hypothetical protein
MKANASRNIEYEPSLARRSSSTSRQTTRYAHLDHPPTRPPHRTLHTTSHIHTLLRPQPAPRHRKNTDADTCDERSRG